jgi:TonB family protein
MLKTQLAGFGLPVGCHWQSSHPLKERIEMLKQPLPARTRKIAGSLFVATIVGCGTWAAWAAQPAATQASATPAAAAKAKPAAAQASYLQYVSDEDVLTAPTYPKGLDVHGKVEIELLVGADGSVKDVSVLKSEPAGVFDAMTVAAARKWHITPARAANGVPFERRVRTVVEYRPDGAPKGEG